MARLAIDVNFMDDFSKLPKPVQALVKTAIEKFGEHTYAGAHLEKVHQCKDDRIRTIRIDRAWRGVVFAEDAGNTYCLVKVLHHDEAYRYAASHKYSVNQALGVVELRDQGALDDIKPALELAATSTETRLFADVGDGDLTKLGIDGDTLKIARLLPSEAHLDAMQKMIPEAQYNVLVGLASGQTPEEVWAEISQYAPDGAIDTDNVVKAMERTPGRVVFVTGNEELEKILEHPFAKWRVFLHPAQRTIAYAPRYAGPVQVSGGAGTGKTVTALHRAAYLAGRLELAPESGPAVLMTTFTRNLADALHAQFELLTDDEDVRQQVEVLNVDRLAYRVVEQARGRKLAIIDGKDLLELWRRAGAGLPFAPSFLNREWEQVILAQDLQGEEEYLAASRAGQGTALGKAQRRQVWQAVQEVAASLRDSGRDTFLLLASEAAWLLRSGAASVPYRHVIIDEAQDLHPMQWRLLRAAVPAGLDDLFIVGDVHQRIYDNRVSLARVGINVKGRSKRLTVNYRTTQEILSLAVPALGRGDVAGLDDEADTLAGYRSPMHGRRPEVAGFASGEAELAALVARVRSWRDEGIESHAIGIAARSSSAHRAASDALAAAGIKAVTLSARSSRDAVRVGTMHGMKGLEFQAVAVIGVADGTVPSPSALTDAAEDTLAYAQDLQRERCLLFVACTRARDHLYVSYSGAPSPFLPVG